MEKERLDTSDSKSTGPDLEIPYSTSDNKEIASPLEAGSRKAEEVEDPIYIPPTQTCEHALSRPHTLHVMRSNRSYGGEDGYSCHQPDPELNQSDEEKRFEVKWDDDDDPLNPRGLSKLRKWIVVFILAGSALCAYEIWPLKLKRS